MSSKAISIRIATEGDGRPARNCSTCLGSAAKPLCQAQALNPPQAVRLLGPPELLTVAVAALLPLLGNAHGTLDGQRVRSLFLQDGEAHLNLAVSRHCVGAELSYDAFQLLRRALPDTDIYVGHAAD